MEKKYSQRYFRTEVVENRAVNHIFRLLIIKKEVPLITPEPGQFYMLNCGNTTDPLLKRPFSIYRTDNKTLQFLYRIRGRGTSLISSLKKGDFIEAIGPLGKGFPDAEGDFIAVAGGIGIASVMPLLEKFRGKGYLFYGARKSSEIVMLKDAETFARDIFISTDDGSEGQKGFITDILKNSLLINMNLPIYACGPNPMLKALSKIVSNRDVRCFVSLEERMACGVGACLGCVVRCKKQDGSEEWTYKRVCKEGPVFDVKELVW